MEQKKFIQVLRKVVRDEVKNVIKQELTEILQEGLQSTISELRPNKKPISKKQNGVFKETKFANILNETTSLREQDPMSDYASIMSEDITMTSKDAQGFPIMRQSFKEAMGVETPVQAILEDPETGKNMNIDPVIAKAMTRDYSALMKAIDKKKNR